MLNKKNDDLESKRKQCKSGFTLMEVIVAIAILGVSFVLVMQLFSGGLKLSRASCDYTRAIVHAKDKMEQLSADPVPGSGEFEDGFRWDSSVEPYLELEEMTVNLMKIEVKVSWDDVGGKQNSVELVSLKTVSGDENI